MGRLSEIRRAHARRGGRESDAVENQTVKTYKMNTPTPETDSIWAKGKNILDHARKLERERDCYKQANEAMAHKSESIIKLMAERDEARLKLNYLKSIHLTAIRSTAESGNSV